MHLPKILPQYIRGRFIHLFLLCMISVIAIFVIVDLVENMDRFIDRNVPVKITVLYYLYFIPYIMVLVTPVATLMATVFSIGGMARNNEVVAMKSLGYSMHHMMRTLLVAGFFISILSFVMNESLVVHANRKKIEIEKDYLGKKKRRIKTRLNNLVIQEPPNTIISIGTYDVNREVANRVKIETFDGYQLVSKIDTPEMRWADDSWIVSSGFERLFNGELETARPVSEPRIFYFQFNPKELVLAQIKPDAMSFKELTWFIKRVRDSGGVVSRWLTEQNIRIAYPLSNVIIILLSLPLVYNRRKKSLAVGFGISLAICFIYFGLVKIGQTMGEKGSMSPVIAAWLGNGVMGLCGIVDIIKTRK